MANDGPLLPPLAKKWSGSTNCSASACVLGVTARPYITSVESDAPLPMSPSTWSYVRFSLMM